MLPDIVEGVIILKGKISYCVPDQVGRFLHQMAGMDINDLIKQFGYMKAKGRLLPVAFR